MEKAIVNTETKIVENVILLDKSSQWSPPDGCIVVDLVSQAGIGWSYIDGEFIAPEAPEAS
jgi:hypothetical protein